MRCEDILGKFLELDNGENLPRKLRQHIQKCSSCKSEIERWQGLFSSFADEDTFEIEVDFSDKIMVEISNLPVKTSSLAFLSPTKWIAIGIFILASILTVGNSDAFIWLNWHFGRNLQIPLYTVMGFVMSGYIALCTGFHLDEIKELAEIYRERI